jgi:hypothetical protein
MNYLLYFIIFIYLVYIILLLNNMFLCENFKNNNYKINKEDEESKEDDESKEYEESKEDDESKEYEESKEDDESKEYEESKEDEESNYYTTGYVYEPRHSNANQNYINKIKLSKYYNEPTKMRPFPSMYMYTGG